MAHINPRSLSSIRLAVKSINEDLRFLRVKIDEPIFNTDSLARRLLKSLRVRNEERSIIKICSRLEQRVLLTHTTLSILGRYMPYIHLKNLRANWAFRGNDLAQIGALATVNENTRLVLHNQTQLQYDTLGPLQCNIAASRQLSREQQQFRVDVLNGQTQLRTDLLDSIKTNHVNNHTPILLHNGSANDAAATLAVVWRLLPFVLVKTTPPGTSRRNSNWVKKGVGNILCGVRVLADSEIQGRQVLVPYGTQRTTQQLAVQALHFVRSQSSSVMTQRSRTSRSVQTMFMTRHEEMELVVHLPEGNLFIWITKGCHIDGGGLSCNLKGFRILFAPNASRLLPGISASCFDYSGNHLKIPSAVRTFGIVPSECDIINRICDGDIEEVRDILKRGECSATDRDMDGDSLLVVRS